MEIIERLIKRLGTIPNPDVIEYHDTWIIYIPGDDIFIKYYPDEKRFLVWSGYYVASEEETPSELEEYIENLGIEFGKRIHPYHDFISYEHPRTKRALMYEVIGDNDEAINSIIEKLEKLKLAAEKMEKFLIKGTLEGLIDG